MPDIFADFLSNFVQMFRFDLAAVLFNVGCLVKSGYVTSLLSNVILALIILLALYAMYLLEAFQIRNQKVTDKEMEAQKQTLMELYNEFDKDGDGLELEELQAAVSKILPSVTKDDVEKLFKMADSDNDSEHSSGVLSFDEFYAAATLEGGDDAFDLAYIVKVQFLASAKADAMEGGFLVIFLLYPSLTNLFFEGFVCRDLGPETSILVTDYSINCDDDSYSSMVLVCGTLVLVWAIGLPAFMFGLMYRSRDLIAAKDKETLQTFDFMIGDFKQSHWYWEIVELGRKLILSGLIGLIGRGSVAQVVLAATMQFSYFAIVFNERPYQKHVLNVIKICSEANLFLILLICCVLQTYGNDFGTEAITIDDYGAVLVFLTILTIPVAVIIAIREARNLDQEASIERADREYDVTEFNNPNSQDAMEINN
jgi:hypothetical protein